MNIKKHLLKPNHKNNIIIGAHVTAFSRIFMHQYLIKLIQNNCKVFLIDTDNFIISCKKGTNVPLPIGASFGEFRIELPKGSEILSFFSLGPKNYALRYLLDGKMHKIVKLRGISLRNVANDHLIDSKLYEEYQNFALKKKVKETLVPQVRVRTSKFSKTSKYHYQRSFFQSSLHSKRIIDPTSSNLISFPYGFCSNY